jgi:hypothetical protein
MRRVANLALTLFILLPYSPGAGGGAAAAPVLADPPGVLPVDLDKGPVVERLDPADVVAIRLADAVAARQPDRNSLTVRFLVARRPSGDLLLRAKHLFVAASHLGWTASEPPHFSRPVSRRIGLRARRGMLR